MRNLSREGAELLVGRWCDSFLCRLRGLTFRRTLPDGRGLVLVERGEDRLSTSIHMWAVFFPIGVAWLDSSLRVVDRKLARPWRLYLPSAPAQYVLEGPPSMLDLIEVGDRLEFVDVARA